MQARIFGPADFKSMPWRNGRGTTTELAREDAADGTMLWRLSSADVIEDGPFSAFPGVDRILVLTEGEGFDLDFGAHGRVSPVEPLTPVPFSGDWPAMAVNVRGASRDLNLMVARDRAAASVAVHHPARSIAQLADRSLFLSLDGDAIVHIGERTFELSPSQLLVVSGVAGFMAETEGDGSLLRAQVTLHL